ncbi:Rv3654c family TadE-like protein [Nocardioides sp. zg-DK7169]|uniref:Rv3654c family TadE-like protein n=1 Tax=Nocardioides sp. zg-DK7169 TaxID=2736600 RepID=UPI0015544F68|nr:Rv3654c family TadE-like protein [Nocardioides sp. zg-DK7169]NPC98272.1 flp pilus-assembly TadE/G-like family protein [Nocardioides sp. zg-DK7169]
MSRGERGGATVLAVALTGLLLLLGVALALVAGVVVAHRQAQSAADLAALGAAGALVDGRDPCTAGSAVAAANGARLVGCAVQGRTVLVRVQVAGPAWREWGVDPVAEARAGQE